MNNNLLSVAIKNVLNTDKISAFISSQNDAVCFCVLSDSASNLVYVHEVLTKYNQGLVSQAIYVLRADTLLFKQPELREYPMCITPENFKYIYLCDKNKDESEQYGAFAKEFNQFGLVGVFCEIGN